MKINKYLLEITLFVSGAVVMIFELVGSRVLGPYFGTSLFVWTGLIGIILGSLSLGYYLGGKKADKSPNLNSLSLIILLAAISIGATVLIKDFLCMLLLSFVDIKIALVLASVVLFSPASVLLGMVSPYIIKLKMENLNISGMTAGNLYAISTAGSILGTFLAGFFLIPWLGTNKLLTGLSITLLLISWMLSPQKYAKIKFFLLAVAIGGWFGIGLIDRVLQAKGFIDVDTAYNRIWIYNRDDPRTGKPVKTMGINNENHSSMFLDSDELVNEYTKYYHLAKHFKPDFKKTLMFGGAGYSYPKDFLLQYPEATIDVVEIDPMTTKLAKEFFRLKEDPRLTIYHEDGRVYLNRTREKYDVIFGDAFSSHHSLPYQLTTREAVKKKYDSLNDNGVVILNISSAIEGERGQFLRAEYATYKNIFPQVFLFPVKEPDQGDKTQGIILVALKSEKIPELVSTDPKLNEYLQHLWKKEVVMDRPILTDDFAPTDYYISKLIF